MIYLQTKKLSFDEENNLIEHEIILNITDKEILGYDYCSDIEWDFNTKIRADGWFSFPLYEFKNNKIIPFNYEDYQYFQNANRRMMLATKINEIYDPFAEKKILRKTLKNIMDILNIEYPDFFKKYNDRIEILINKNPKDKSK